MNNQNNTIRYDYVDENNNVIFTKIRTANPKSFYFERHINGQIVRNLEDVPKVLYRLPEVLTGIQNNQLIYCVEGEKDVETLRGNRIIATTAHTTTYWPEEYTKLFNKANVIILFDKDKAGIQRQDNLTQSMRGKVKNLKVIDLPGLEDNSGNDITDWFEQGHTVEELQKLVDDAEHIQILPSEAVTNIIGLTQSHGLTAIGLKTFLNMDIPVREMFLDPIIPGQGLAMLVAKRGVGKTHVALGIAFAIATGGSFLRWKAPKARAVLYLDGEMAQKNMQDRLKQLIVMFDDIYDPDTDFFQLLTPDHQPSGMPDLSTKAGRDSIDHFIQKADFIVIDNISCLFRSGGENDAEEWQEAQEWALYLRRIGKSILFVHHMGKNGLQRGTSKREDILDTVISLKHPDDYSPEDGAYFEINFDKARHFTGQDAESFCVKLLTDENGKSKWEYAQTKEDLLIEEIAELKSRKLTIKEMVNETKLTKSQIETLLGKAKNKGLI